MTPSTLVDFLCWRCSGTGKVHYVRRPHQRKRKPIPCTHCGSTGKITRSIEQSCHLQIAASEPDYYARKIAPIMAQAAIEFARINPWCDVKQAIAVVNQSPDFHAPSRIRSERRELLEMAARRKGLRMGQIPSRRRLAEQHYKDIGTTIMLRCLETYRAGHLSITLFELLTPGERFSMLARLGFSAHGHMQLFGSGKVA